MGKSSYDYEELLACARGELFGPGNAQLPYPPMLMFNRISEISEKGGEFDKGFVRAELDVSRDLWFFPCHFIQDPVMPGCLGLDALWQLSGFFLGWLGEPGKGRALSTGEVKFTGMVTPANKKVEYGVDFKRVMRGRLVLGIGDGWLKADGETIYKATDLQSRPVQAGGVTVSLVARELRMRRVVVSGLGIVSSIGNNANEVQASLHDARSGISFSDSFAEHGFRCQVWGAPTLDPSEIVDRRAMRFLSKGGAWNHVAMEQAITDSGLEPGDVTNERTGIVMGSGGPSTRTIVEAAEITRKNNSPKRIGPFAVPKAMSSTASATLATWFKIHGVNYSISSACSTSAHCIGNAYELIQWGKQDVIFAGGHEDLDWTMSNLFDAMGAMSSKYNDRAPTASRAYDVNRDGFVIAGGRRRAGGRGTGARQSARRQNLCRDRRLRRYLGWVRHGCPVGRRRRAMHAAGAVDRRRRRRLHQHARHIDAGRRFARDGRHPRGIRRDNAEHHID